MHHSKNNSTVVIVGTYNPTSFLNDQLNSILDQKNPDITIHVSDDCSDQNYNLENLKKK